mmetsp:Transcript_60785/g.84546  ORF Transcript_60785/g.84546 Transcript_60785/m.84546 type:complete len:91 (+) Transcript_60785:679-951(+)
MHVACVQFCQLRRVGFTLGLQSKPLPVYSVGMCASLEVWCTFQQHQQKFSLWSHGKIALQSCRDRVASASWARMVAEHVRVEDGVEARKG